MENTAFGDLNGYTIGIVLKECVRRAMEVIRAHRYSHKVREKHTPGKKFDVVTDADEAAQKVYVKIIKRAFPTFGIVAEEDGLSVPCTHPELDIYVTVDPLDGTKAFSRWQAHGVGTMVSVVCNGEVVAAYIGDAIAQEVYGFRPGSVTVHMVCEDGFAEDLGTRLTQELSGAAILLRESESAHSHTAQLLFHSSVHSPLFTKTVFSSGSIGLSMARLWKGEVGAAVLLPGRNTPWDLMPVLGICQKLDFVFLALDPKTGRYKEFTCPVSQQAIEIQEELIVVQSRHVQLLNGHLAVIR
ncbi:MAG: inositol monophosphatase family protein [Patescibacteria group bacterium]